MGENLDDLGLDDDFLDTMQKAPCIEEISDKLGFIKTKKLLLCDCQCKEKEKNKPEGEIIFANNTSDKGLLSKIYKELLKLSKKKKKQTIQWKIGQKMWTDTSRSRYADGK